MNTKDFGDNGKILYLIERIDAGTTGAVDQALRDLCSSGAMTVVCNMEGTEYVSSAGLRTFLVHAKSMKKAGGELRFCGLKPYVHEIFEIAGLTSILSVFETEQAAIGS